jgi:hypothetical protein
MRCEDALVTMLDADVADLTGTGPDALARHIRSCAKCAALAATLRGETERLARAFGESNGVVAVATRRARRRVRRRVVVPATALAASVMLAIILRSPAQLAVVRAQPDVRVAEVPTVPAVPIAEPAKTPPRIARALVRLPSPAATVPVAIQAVAVVAAPADVATIPPDLQVDPEPGTRATVMRGRNPNITVVWLTK